MDTENREVLREKTPSGQPNIHAEMDHDTKSTGIDKEPAICVKCKWRKMYDRYIDCISPCMTDRCWVSGAYKYPSCAIINRDGNCSHYEKRISWIKRCWRWICKYTRLGTAV